MIGMLTGTCLVAGSGEAIIDVNGVGYVALAGTRLLSQTRISHHEKLIEIVGRNGKEPQAFKQRVRDVARLFQNALIELEPGQLAINVSL